MLLSLDIIDVLLKLHLLLKKLLNVATEGIDTMATCLTFIAQMEESLFILGAHRVANASEDLRILLEPLRVLQILESLSRLDAVLGAQLLVLVVVFAF